MSGGSSIGRSALRPAGPLGWRRGIVLAATLAATLASCGWRPVYAPARPDGAAEPGSGAGSVAGALAGVDVAVINERSGQLLRQALQARLQHSSGEEAPVYQLQANYSVSRDGIAVTAQSSVTRIRMIATASYTLSALGRAARTCFSGNARAVDGYDVENQQFFASDLEGETVERRLADATADQIVTRLALFLRAGASACAAR